MMPIPWGNVGTPGRSDAVTSSGITLLAADWSGTGCPQPRGRAVSWRPQGDSNPRYRRERAMSWASRRWGRTKIGGARRDRTVDLLHAMQALSQLSYGPTRGAANYGPLSGMSSKQKRLHHIVRPLGPSTPSPY